MAWALPIATSLTSLRPDDRHGVVAVLLGPVPQLGLVVDSPRLERAVAHHGEAELEAAPDLADALHPLGGHGAVLVGAGEAGSHLFGPVDPPIDRHRSALDRRATGFGGAGGGRHGPAHERQQRERRRQGVQGQGHPPAGGRWRERPRPAGRGPPHNAPHHTTAPRAARRFRPRAPRRPVPHGVTGAA